MIIWKKTSLTNYKINHHVMMIYIISNQYNKEYQIYLFKYLSELKLNQKSWEFIKKEDWKCFKILILKLFSFHNVFELINQIGILLIIHF